MDPIMDLAAARGIKVIEDCAQAHGARYKGRSVGSIGHVSAWSFCQDKIMTTGGEGGMVTRSEEHPSELQSLMRISYAVFCLKKKKTLNKTKQSTTCQKLA